MPLRIVHRSLEYVPFYPYQLLCGLLTFLTIALAVPAIYGATVWYAPDNVHRLNAESSSA